MLYSETEEKRDPVKAYRQLLKAVGRGVTYFDQLHNYFKDNIATLGPEFCTIRAPPASVDRSDDSQLINLHEAMINEQKQSFMTALGKDRMYKRACGSVTDQQIWMLGVLTKYFINKVMRMDHADFIRALKTDLGPMIGDTGLWALKNYQEAQTLKGNDEKKKIARCAIDLMTKYLDSGMDVLGVEKKYNMLNRFGPKKCPDKKVVRGTIPILYSWMHYAPLNWFEQQKQFQSACAASADHQGGPQFKLCSYCSAPEGDSVKHKQCSQCKQMYYCSVKCQRAHW